MGEVALACDVGRDIRGDIRHLRPLDRLRPPRGGVRPPCLRRPPVRRLRPPARVRPPRGRDAHARLQRLCVQRGRRRRPEQTRGRPPSAAIASPLRPARRPHEHVRLALRQQTEAGADAVAPGVVRLPVRREEDALAGEARRAHGDVRRIPVGGQAETGRGEAGAEIRDFWGVHVARRQD